MAWPVSLISRNMLFRRNWHRPVTGGCRDVTGPVPRSLWIRNIYVIYGIKGYLIHIVLSRRFLTKLVGNVAAVTIGCDMPDEFVRIVDSGQGGFLLRAVSIGKRTRISPAVAVSGICPAYGKQLPERIFMRYVRCSHFLLGLVLLLLSPIPALAVPAITCHCFTDRSYDPAHPTVADPYFLASAQNSFFAAAFGVDKKTIVIKKQKGSSAEDLWIAYWLAARSGADPDALLQARKAKGTWQQVAVSSGLLATTQAGKASAALNANAADARLADAIVDDLLLRFRLYIEGELTALRKGGAANQELVLGALIAAKTRRTATQICREVKAGKISWGGELQRARIEPSDIQKEIASLVSRQ